MRTMSRIALLAAVAFAALSGTANAGGWATVELGETPSGLVAGEPWHVELIIKQHGVTPMADLSPSVRIINDAGVVKTFYAEPTAKVGTYVAEVTFPAGGEWRTRIFDGFTDAAPHRLAPLDVAPSGSALASAGGFPWEKTVAIGFVALLFLVGLAATFGRPSLRRRIGSVTLRGRAA
jgi:hypothetical protein